MAENETTPRTLDELLRLNTYQGMSDEEIQSLIVYHVNNQVQSIEHAERMQIFKDYTERRLQLAMGLSTQALEDFNSLNEAIAAARREQELKLPGIAELEPMPEFLEVTDEQE